MRPAAVVTLAVLIAICLALVVVVVRQILSQRLLRRLSGELQARQSYYESLLEDSADAIMIARRDGSLSYVSPAGERILGAQAVWTDVKVWTAIALPRRAFAAAVQRLDAGETSPQLIEGRREHVVFEAALSLRGQDVLVSVRDVTERDRLRQRLHYLAYHDPLTGLANRSRVLSRIAAMLSREELCAVLFIDLDRFKQVNDNSGHAIGDLVLQEVAARLSRVVRSGDLTGRLGGDEFVAVISAGVVEAEAVAGRIHELIGAPFDVGGRHYQLGSSIGIALAMPGLQAEDLLRRADQAMYAAKRQRGTWRVYASDLGRAALVQANIDESVSRALRDRDLDLFLQPLVDLDSGRVVSVEALLRWRDSSGRVNGPAHVLDFARRSGRMPELTQWVLQRAIGMAGKSPTDVRIAVNLSPEMLLQPAMPQHIAALLAAGGVPASRLEVEVTEDQILEQMDPSINTLRELERLGISVMIDDFGTGFSSMGYLLDQPIEGLKIDQRFTKALPVSESARTIVAGLVSHRARSRPAGGRRGDRDRGTPRVGPPPRRAHRPGLLVRPA